MRRRGSLESRVPRRGLQHRRHLRRRRARRCRGARRCMDRLRFPRRTARATTSASFVGGLRREPAPSTQDLTHGEDTLASAAFDTAHAAHAQ
jgi:hypothetical protein